MAQILCVTNGLPGMLFSSMELTRRLIAAGHVVQYVSYPHTERTVRNHGLDFIPLEPSRYPDFWKADTRASLPDRLRRLESRRQEAVESWGLSSFLETLRQTRPELLLIDGELHEQIIAATRTGVPIALLNTFTSIWRQPGVPPPGRLITPGVGWAGTAAGISLAWSELRLRKLIRAQRQKLERAGCDRISILRRIAKESGFDFERETDAGHWLIPFTYSRLPYLSLHPCEFEFPHEPLANVRYLGPMILEDRVDDRITEDVRARIAAVVERRRNNSNRRLLFAGFGSFFTSNKGFLQRLFAAVSSRQDWELVVSLGGRLDPKELGPLPERVHAFRWLNQLDVLRHADVAVTHGGINTLDECVACAVPMLLYCGFETDMAGNTARVGFHQLGLQGDQGDSAARMQSRLDRLLDEPPFQQNVERMSKAYARYADDQVAERTIESLLPG